MQLVLFADTMNIYTALCMSALRIIIYHNLYSHVQIKLNILLCFSETLLYDIVCFYISCSNYNWDSAGYSATYCKYIHSGDLREHLPVCVHLS